MYGMHIDFDAESMKELSKKLKPSLSYVLRNRGNKTRVIVMEVITRKSPVRVTQKMIKRTSRLLWCINLLSCLFR